MKFQLFYFYNAAIHLAISKGNIDIIKLLLKNEKLNVNLKNKIHTINYSYGFKLFCLNSVFNQVFK